MTRPLLLDLFCGGGGAAMGYWRAGFDVVGVDLAPQPDYPFTFVRRNALTIDLVEHQGRGFDAVHASPPCKPFTTAGGAARRRARLFPLDEDCLTPMLERLAGVDVPWVVENVVGAPMPPGSLMLCGSAFGLDVRRHRLFASNVPLTGPPCDHARQAPRFASLDHKRRRAGLLAGVVGVYGNVQGAGELALRQRAMGIDWLPNDTLTQAIPPAFTEHIGAQVLDVIRSRSARKALVDDGRVHSERRDQGS